MASTSTLILIPARMASTRLPGKPLADIAGLPMIVQVVRRAEEANIGRAVVATDTAEIAEVVRAHGGEAVMTRADHPSGSDRIFEALQQLDPDGRVETIVNLQGDLPTIPPQDIQAVAELLRVSRASDIATLGASLGDEDYTNLNVVKVAGKGGEYLEPMQHARSFDPTVTSLVRSAGAYASMESTSPTTFEAKDFRREIIQNSGTNYHHIGIYAYRRAALAKFVGLPPSVREMERRLEQMRAMDSGMRIEVRVVDSVPLGVDTPADLETARRMLG